ncbi:MAG: 1-(5-phosphoribosyl)-5-[(5-phosphoribosylamino)methylideneamino]imidazole-4-carboxamide isomerase [Ignavibacteriales bacterium]|nr:1-(5-phosphoribosyl)-5-[(5-phosphoribosylamino)methylideneamino]imidazole-4-carboxamide isomerase [Ignavibacteriales bacterium]
MLIIPAIDIINNKIVRLQKGNFYDITYYNKTLIEYANLFNKYDIKWLHLIDLLASKNGCFNIANTIVEIKKETDLSLQVGGGVRNYQDFEERINLGVDRVIVGTLSVKNKPNFERICGNYSNEKIIVAVDVLDDDIMIKGWTENSKIKLSEHLKYCVDLGIEIFLCTDISKDGMLKGPNFDMYEKLQQEFPKLKFIASGGISKTKDIIKLKEMNMYATVVGKAIYENKITIEELKEIGS